MRHALLLALGAAAALLAGCGGGDENAPTASRPATTAVEPEPPLTEHDAVVETQSVASQEAFKRDFSFPATAISATCTPLSAQDGRARFACRYRSPKDSCTGTTQIVRLADGSNGSRRFTIKCQGPPNIGPDTSDPNFNPDG